MACNCSVYQCLNVDYDPCSNGVELPLQSTETGTWVVLIEFNGTWIRLNVEVTEDENIVIPNVLNEHYTHTIRLLTIDKDLFNDICYKIVTNTTSGLDIPLPSPGGDSGGGVQPVLYFTTYPGQSTYQSDLLIGATIIMVELEGAPYTNYTFNSETGEIVTPLFLPEGGTLSVLYSI